MLKIKKIEYIHEVDKNNSHNQYVDVLIHLNNMRTYTATIVTPNSIAKYLEMERLGKTGSNGVCYPNDVDMLIVKDTSKETIEIALRYMIEIEKNLSQFLEISNENFS